MPSFTRATGCRHISAVLALTVIISYSEEDEEEKRAVDRDGNVYMTVEELKEQEAKARAGIVCDGNTNN